MQLRTITRVAAVVTLALIASGAAATVFAPTAGAAAQQRITIGPDQTLDFDYPELVGSGQAQLLVDAATAFSPDDCATVTWCDTIPITVAPPVTDLSSSDFYIHIVITWDTTKLSVPAYGPATANDVDIAIWDDPVVPDSGPDGNGIRQHSATGNMPEQLTLVDPTGDFNLVVLNSSGINSGYHLQVSWSTQLIPTPFESLPSDFSSTGAVGAPAAGPSSRLALGSPQAPAPLPQAQIGGASLPPLPAEADTAFGAPASASNFNQGLSNQALLNTRPATAKRELKAPSNLALLLWLLALPFGITAIGGQLLLGRSRALLRI